MMTDEKAIREDICAGLRPTTDLKGFAWIGDTKLIHVENQLIFLSHYAHRVWDQSHRGSWNLSGHSHGNLADLPTYLATDVGVERTEIITKGLAKFAPVEFSEIREYLKDRKWSFNTGGGDSDDTVAD